jgi:hypothetical protein
MYNKAEPFSAKTAKGPVIVLDAKGRGLIRPAF